MSITAKLRNKIFRSRHPLLSDIINKELTDNPSFKMLNFKLIYNPSGYEFTFVDNDKRIKKIFTKRDENLELPDINEEEQI